MKMLAKPFNGFFWVQNKVQLLIVVTLLLSLLQSVLVAQPLLETGSQKPMPNVWIDKDTHHKIVRLSQIPGSSLSFYFHNNPFIPQQKKEGDKMVFYNTLNSNKQLFTVNLKTFAIDQITTQPGGKGGEIVAPKGRNVFYQIKDSVFCTNIETKKTRLVFVFPEYYKGSVTTLNANETILAGARADDRQKEIYKQYPEKSQYFNRIFDAHLPNDLFTVNVQTGELKKIHTDTTWLGHIQFSPTDPNILSFCHEGPWHKVDRIWQINISNGAVKKMHTRTIDMEIAGHEWYSKDGKKLWYDLQMPRGQNFFVAAAEVYDSDAPSLGGDGNNKPLRYRITRDEWSIHFNTSNNNKLFCGDGGNEGQVAKAKNGMWIYLFKPDADRLISEKLVNMKWHNYKLEPNVHFTPDDKWVVFRANFEGVEQVYAVEIAAQK